MIILRHVRNRTRQGVQENLELLVGGAMIVLLAASLALMGCPELEWCPLNVIELQ